MDIQLLNISQKFDSKVVLNQINLHFQEGQTHVLLGSSGCGKSTLLKIIAGVIHPNLGEVSFSGHLLTSMAQHQIAKHIGYVIQEGGLFPHLTAKENITLVSRIFHWSKQAKIHRLKELLEMVNLDESILKRYPKELSGGQKQRVSLMRACFLNPDIMLLDEPLGALDPLIRADLQDELKKIFDRLRKTVVLVTHDLGEAKFFGQTITLLQEGQVLQQGSYSDLVNQPSDPFVTLFIGAQNHLYNLGR